MPLRYDENQLRRLDELVEAYPVMGMLAGNIAEAVDEHAFFNPQLAQTILLEKLYKFGDYGAEAADSLIKTLLDLERLGGLSHSATQDFISQITALIAR